LNTHVKTKDDSTGWILLKRGSDRQTSATFAINEFSEGEIFIDINAPIHMLLRDILARWLIAASRVPTGKTLCRSICVEPTIWESPEGEQWGKKFLPLIRIH
jgi:hypothetical protein